MVAMWLDLAPFRNSENFADLADYSGRLSCGLSHCYWEIGSLRQLLLLNAAML